MSVWLLMLCPWKKMIWKLIPHSLHESAVCSKQWCHWYHSLVGYCLQKKEKENIFFHQLPKHSCTSNTMSATDTIRTRTLFSALKVFNSVAIVQRKFNSYSVIPCYELKSQWRPVKKLLLLQFIILFFVYRNSYFVTHSKYLFHARHSSYCDNLIIMKSVADFSYIIL
jgi:hypothetical protein